jgi:hypothetical protein
VHLIDEVCGDDIMSIFEQNGIPTIDNLIKYCFERISLWAGAYNVFRYHTEGSGKIELVFEHKFGIKWSRILGSGFSKLIHKTRDSLKVAEHHLLQ